MQSFLVENMTLPCNRGMMAFIGPPYSHFKYHARCVWLQQTVHLKRKERWPRGSHISSSNEERVSKGAGEEWVRLMLLLNTERAGLLLVSVETNVCCSVLAGDKMELKKGKKRQLSLFFFTPPGKADETKWCKSSFFSSFLLFFFFIQLGPVLSMSKWQMTTSQAVSIRLNRAACGRFSGLFWTVTFCSPECFLKTQLWANAFNKSSHFILAQLVLFFFLLDLSAFLCRVFQCFSAY